MKKFEITKEQIEKLAEFRYSQSDLTNRLKCWFPEAFKEPFTGWAKDPRPDRNQIWISYFENDEFKYGISSDGNWFKNEIQHSAKYSDMTYIRPATPQEVETALIAEAKKRYKKGDCIEGLYLEKHSFLDFKKIFINGKNNPFYVDKYFKLWMSIGNNMNDIVFDKGTWATIIEQPLTLEERIE